MAIEDFYDFSLIGQHQRLEFRIKPVRINASKPERQGTQRNSWHDLYPAGGLNLDIEQFVGNGLCAFDPPYLGLCIQRKTFTHPSQNHADALIRQSDSDKLLLI